MLPRRHGHVSHVRSACKAKTAESSLSKANDMSDIANEMYDDIKKGMGSSVGWKNEKTSGSQAAQALNHKRIPRLLCS